MCEVFTFIWWHTMLYIQGEWGTTGAEADAEYERRALFVRKSVSSYRSQFTVLQKNYQVMTQWLAVHYIMLTIMYYTCTGYGWRADISARGSCWSEFTIPQLSTGLQWTLQVTGYKEQWKNVQKETKKKIKCCMVKFSSNVTNLFGHEWCLVCWIS